MDRLKPEHKSDEVVIQRVLRGEKDAFRILVERYKDQVAGIVINMIGDRNIADDVGQEVFLRLYRSLGKFEGRSQLGTYIGRIAINLSLNELKRMKKKNDRYGTSTEQLHHLPDHTGSENQFENKELIRKALGKLKEEHRSIIVLRMIEGFSTRETSDMLKIPQGTVLSRLSRGQEKMKQVLEDLGFKMND